MIGIKDINQKNWSKREISSRKTDCLFDDLTVLEMDRQIFRLHNRSDNYEVTLSGVHSTHQ